MEAIVTTDAHITSIANTTMPRAGRAITATSTRLFIILARETASSKNKREKGSTFETLAILIEGAAFPDGVFEENPLNLLVPAGTSKQPLASPINEVRERVST